MLFLAPVGLLPLCPAKVFCQGLNTDSAQRYVILDTAKTATLQKEVDQAAAAGYRVVLGDAAYNVLILEKASAPPRREYRVLWSLQNQLKKASDEGFRVIPATLGTKDWPGAVVEKDPDSAVWYDYLVVDASRTATFEREIAEGAGNGYGIVGMVSGENEHVAVLERPRGGEAGASTRATPSDRFKLVATNKSSTLQTELSQLAARGYRVQFASAAKETLVLLEKTPEAKENLEYIVLATTKSVTFQHELNNAASRGFRLVPRTLIAVQKTLLGKAVAHEVGAVMGKSVTPGPQYEYLVLGTKRVSTLAKELAEAVSQGYEIADMMIGYDEQVIVLERRRTG
jgi:hypothetical protein